MRGSLIICGPGRNALAITPPDFWRRSAIAGLRFLIEQRKAVLRRPVIV